MTSRLGRSPGEGNGYPPQDSCLENSMAREPDGLQSMGSQRVRHNSVTFTLVTIEIVLEDQVEKQ